MQRNKRVIHALTQKHSFEAGAMDMFKNIFKTEPKKDKTAFELEKTFQYDKDFKELLEKTFFKPKWVEDNCKEFVSLDNHEYPFLSIVETKDDFVVAEDLIKGLESFRKTMEGSLENYKKVLKWGNDTFEKINAEVAKVRPNDKDFKEGLLDEDDLTDEERDRAEEIIAEQVKKYKSESEKLEKSLKPVTVKYTDDLLLEKSTFKLTGESRELKIELSEMVKFLEYFKTNTVPDEDESLYESDHPPYFDYTCALFTFETGRIEVSSIVFSAHLPQGYYSVGDASKFVSVKTLVDVLKQFIDK